MDTKHQHWCASCGDTWICFQHCVGYSPTETLAHEECNLCHATRVRASGALHFYSDTMPRDERSGTRDVFDRFAAFVDAIRDLLRWINVANKLELGSVVLRSNVEQVLDRRGCDCVCEVDYWLCMSHEIRSELSRSFDVEMVLRKEGEALLEKGSKNEL